MTAMNEKAATPRGFHVPWLLIIVLLILAAGYANFALPCMFASTNSTHETATVMNLKALATAQAQYHKRFDRFAATATALQQANGLIREDLAQAFPEQVQPNGLRQAPTAVAGYLFLMLAPAPVAGGSTGAAGNAVQWAAIARPAEAGTSGENEYLITADGVVLKKEAVRDPKLLGYRQFFVKSYADIAAADGTIDVSRLQADGWKVAH